MARTTGQSISALVTQALAEFFQHNFALRAAEMADKGQQQPHVKLAMGVINHSIEPLLLLTGMDLAKFNQMTGGFTYDQGGPLKGPDDILVDRLYAKQHHLQAGQTYRLINHDWRVTGVIEPGKLAKLASLM